MTAVSKVLLTQPNLAVADRKPAVSLGGQNKLTPGMGAFQILNQLLDYCIYSREPWSIIAESPAHPNRLEETHRKNKLSQYLSSWLNYWKVIRRDFHSPVIETPVPVLSKTHLPPRSTIVVPYTNLNKPRYKHTRHSGWETIPNFTDEIITHTTLCV